MAGEDVGGGVEVVFDVVRGDAGLTEAGRDQLQFSGIGANIAGGKDTGAARLHEAVDVDLASHQIQAPIFERTEGAFKADVDQHLIDGQSFFDTRPIVVNNCLL